MNSLHLFAQVTNAPGDTSVFFLEPNYLAPIIAGVIIALAFEMFLTMLSVATGLTLVDVPGLNENDENRDGFDQAGQDDTSFSTALRDRIRKAINACGVWATVSGVLSLFFASWLAVELSLATTETSAAVLGLVIWGLFCIIVYYLNLSVGGTTLRSAMSGIRSIGQSVSATFTKSPAKANATEATRAVRREIFGSEEFHQMKRDMRDYIRDVADRISDDEADDTPPPRPVDPQETAQLPPSDRTVEAVLRAGGHDPAKARETRERVEAYLRDTGREELNPDDIKREFQDAFKGGGSTALRQRWEQLDRESLKALLANRSDLNEQEVEQIFQWVEAALASVRGSLASTRDRARDYTDRVQDDRISYDDFEDDVRQLLDDPRAGFDSLQSRLRSLDRDTIVQMLAARKDVSQERAEKLVTRVERARDRLIEQIERVKEAAAEKARAAREAALRTADEVREAAAATAWWAVGASALSGTAAVIGGIVAVSW